LIVAGTFVTVKDPVTVAGSINVTAAVIFAILKSLKVEPFEVIVCSVVPANTTLPLLFVKVPPVVVQLPVTVIELFAVDTSNVPCVSVTLLKVFPAVNTRVLVLSPAISKLLYVHGFNVIVLDAVPVYFTVDPAPLVKLVVRFVASVPRNTNVPLFVKPVELIVQFAPPVPVFKVPLLVNDVFERL